MVKNCKYCKNEEQKLQEELIRCASCKGFSHPSCLELPSNIVPAVKLYDWQCNDCKHCYECSDIANEDQILFCDACDRGYHMYCAKPKLKKKPKGDWFCPICVETRKKESSKKSSSTTDANSEKTTENDPRDTKENNSVKPLPVAKKYSPTKCCPFPGCDGTGNVRSNSSVHFAITQCPMSRDERKRERELLASNQNEDSEPSAKQAKNIEPNNKQNKEDAVISVPPSFNQTPIEHIVSKTDIDLFNTASREALELLALDREMAPNPDGLKSIVFGDVEIQAWYKSQYPLEFSRIPKLYICEFCLNYMKTETIYKRHMAKCTTLHPPGDEIYRKDELSVFEVNGQTATTYCQNLCLMAKLFLDHKTLWLDVAPFLFYVMTVVDDSGCHIVGYFSKEKVSFLNYNVSCILVMPHYMKKGYGRMLIDFSYLLSKVEGKTGSPERPLSDLGLVSYRKFWADKLLRYLMAFNEENISIKGISEQMSIHANDVISTLQYLGMLKYWKGKHLILLKKEIIEEYASKVKERPSDYKEIDLNSLKWKPTTYK